MMIEKELLTIQNLVTSFRINGQYYAAVDGVSMSVKENEVFAIVRMREKRTGSFYYAPA